MTVGAGVVRSGVGAFMAARAGGLCGPRCSFPLQDVDSRSSGSNGSHIRNGIIVTKYVLHLPGEGELFPRCPEYAVIPAYFDKEAIYGNGS